MIRPRSQRHLLVRGATLVTFDEDRRVLEGDVLVSDGRIAAVGERLTAPSATRLLEAEGLHVIPGLVQAHVHLGHRLFRGRLPESPGPDDARRVAALEALHTEDTARSSALLAAAECLLSGTTTVAEFGLPLAVMRGVLAALEESGLRGLVGARADIPGGEPDAPGGESPLENALDFAAGVADSAPGRLRGMLALDLGETPSAPGLIAAARGASRRGLGLHLHARPGVPLARDVEDALAEASPVVLAHGIHAWGGRIPRKEEGSAGIVHCPEAEAKMSAVPADLSGGSRSWGTGLGMGTDGYAGRSGFDLREDLRMAVAMEARGSRTGRWGAVEAMEAATVGGARALGLAGESGSLEPGKAGDLVVLDLRGVHGFAPVEASLAGRIFMSGGRSSIRWVVVDGEVLVESGRLPHLDLDRLERETRGAAGVLARTRRAV